MDVVILIFFYKSKESPILVNSRGQPTTMTGYNTWCYYFCLSLNQILLIKCLIRRCNVPPTNTFMHDICVENLVMHGNDLRLFQTKEFSPTLTIYEIIVPSHTTQQTTNTFFAQPLSGSYNCACLEKKLIPYFKLSEQGGVPQCSG